jgi:glycosyltransferase involved in cell wall biosynthesis
MNTTVGSGQFAGETAGVPGVSVVVLSRPDAADLADSLASLSGQHEVPGRLEVVLVLFGSPGALGEAQAFRRLYPDLRLRVVSRRDADRAAAREAGIAAARCEYLTIIDGGDAVGPAFVRTLHEAARPGIIPMIEPSGGTPGKEPGQALRAEDLAAALAFDGGKLLPTARAQHITTERGAGKRADASFWAQLLASAEFSLQACGGGAAAGYHRRPAEPDADGFAVSVTEPLAVIEGIESAMDIASESAVSAMDAWIGAEAGRLRAYVEDHPAQRQRVIDAIDNSAIINVPAGEINAGTATGLVISYCFPPYVDTAAVVAAKRVRQRGEVVDVIFNAMDRLRHTEMSTRRIADPFISREAAIPSPSAFASWASIESFRELGIAQIEAWEEQQGCYRNVYSRAQFAASHFLAADYKLSRPTVRWTAEFSDPLSRDVQGKERGAPAEEGPFLRRLRTGFRERGVEPPASDNTFVWCEWAAYVLADEVLFTNVNQREYMLGLCPDAVAGMVRAKSVIAPHPTLPPSFYSMQHPEYAIPPDQVNIAYFGNFYATRGLDDLLVAMAGLPASQREKVCLHVFTGTPDELRRRGAELDLDRQLRVGPYFGFLDFLNLTTRLDCLLVNDAVTDSQVRNPFLPSKWSDYRGSGTPVWGLLEEGSPLSAEPLTYTSPVGDVEAARQVLIDLITAHGQDRDTGARPAVVS